MGEKKTTSTIKHILQNPLNPLSKANPPSLSTSPTSLQFHNLLSIFTAALIPSATACTAAVPPKRLIFY